ncbi:hypothetical protein EDB89DRAFT_1317276 [Lactarius sanguifluus]|nr:hypothetical protein EDB89DRAFT_1317276 [Lactarius sanguifluus]
MASGLFHLFETTQIIITPPDPSAHVFISLVHLNPLNFKTTRKPTTTWHLITELLPPPPSAVRYSAGNGTLWLTSYGWRAVCGSNSFLDHSVSNPGLVARTLPEMSLQYVSAASGEAFPSTNMATLRTKFYTVLLLFAFAPYVCVACEKTRGKIRLAEPGLAYHTLS